MTRFVSHTDLKMRYVAAALLLALAEDKITAANIEKILSSVGVESDKEKLALVRNRFLLSAGSNLETLNSNLSVNQLCLSSGSNF